MRARILAAVVSLAALGMALAGATAYLLQRERTDELVDAALARSVEEFRTLAAEGVDPATGQPFTSVRALLFTALQRTVPAAHEGMFALVDGQVELVADPVVPTRIERVPEVVAAAAAAAGGSQVWARTLRTEESSYRVVAVPVGVVGDATSGVLVYGFDREAEHAELVRTYRTYALVGGGALVLLAAVGWVVAGRLLAPLRDLRTTAQRITETDLSERIAVTGADDVSDLARTVNSMLDRLEAAFASQKRLLDDAGHELRTPLTIVRGHLELVDADDPADVRATQELVLDELDRMHRLTEDLVTLASVDRPGSLRLAPVDLGVLTDDVLDKARPLGERRWTVSDRAAVTVPADAHRLTQAWLQLAANAVRYSPAGSTVSLGSSVAGDRVRLWVQDEGTGISPDDLDRVFERFVRGAAGRGVEGSGLGLPIVRAIAEAHGGRAFAEPDRHVGARVVVEIPLGNADRGGA